MDAQVGYSVAGRMRSWVALRAVCTMHVETRSVNFLVEPQNQVRRFVNDLASKSLGQFLRFDLKTGGDGFLVEPQNQGGAGFFGLDLKIGNYGLVIWTSKSPNHRDSFFVWASKPNRVRFIGCATKSMEGCDGVGHTSRSSSLLHMKANMARVSQSGLKTGGGAMVGGTCGTITEVTSESS
jgi:hypothetical protein